MRNVLLIGGAGYIGSVITSYLLKKGYKVTVLDNFIYKNQFAVLPFIGDSDYNLIHGDINNNVDLDIASRGISDVVLLAGLVGDPITKKYPQESKLINEDGVRNCMNYFNGKSIDKFIFISTCSNYGLIKENELATENYPLKPLSLYAKAKVANELYLLNKKDIFDYTGVVLRFATAFGLSPRMRFDLTINEFVRDLFMGKELLVYDENTWRPYCHVKDLARLIDIVLNAEKKKVQFEVFNAGGDINNFTKKMIVNEILSKIKNAKVTYGTNGSDPRNYRVSFAKVKKILNFEPKIKVQNGINELVKLLEMGAFVDSIEMKEKYCNYIINYIV